MDAQLIDIEEINLDALTLEELLQERADVRIAIAEISTQLMVQAGRPDMPEDDSSAWCAFRDWRRRARLALMHRRTELEDIKVLLVLRNHERAVANKQHRSTVLMLAPESACHTPEEYTALRESATERRAALLASLNADGAPERLILRLYRALRHLLPSGDGLPDTLDSNDRLALSEASIFLRSKFTTSGVHDFVNSVPEAAP